MYWPEGNAGRNKTACSVFNDLVAYCCKLSIISPYICGYFCYGSNSFLREANSEKQNLVQRNNSRLITWYTARITQRTAREFNNNATAVCKWEWGCLWFKGSFFVERELCQRCLLLKVAVGHMRRCFTRARDGLVPVSVLPHLFVCLRVLRRNNRCGCFVNDAAAATDLVLYLCSCQCKKKHTQKCAREDGGGLQTIRFHIANWDFSELWQQQQQSEIYTKCSP